MTTHVMMATLSPVVSLGLPVQLLPTKLCGAAVETVDSQQEVVDSGGVKVLFLRRGCTGRPGHDPGPGAAQRGGGA